MPTDLVRHIRNGESPPFRPVVPVSTDKTLLPQMVDLVQTCWAEDPDQRPDFPDIKNRLRAINKGK